MVSRCDNNNDNNNNDDNDDNNNNMVYAVVLWSIKEDRNVWLMRWLLRNAYNTDLVLILL